MRVLLHFTKADLLLLSLASCVVLGAVGCSTPSSRERIEARNAGSRASPDTYASELFYATQPETPNRPVHRWEFFYKDCELARRNLQMSRNEWECSER